MTDELRRWRELCEDRDALIFEARERGASFRELQDATGLSRMALHNVIVRVGGQSQAQTLGEVAA
jgi:lambda repressor-like predicted transcriptional regulator